MRERETGRSRSRKQKKANKKPWLLSAAAVTAAAVVIISAVTALRGRDTLTVSGPVYTSVNGYRMDWADGVRLTHKDDVTTMRANKEKWDMETYPLITEDGSIILQKSYSWNRTSDDFMSRVDYFSTVSREEDGITIRRRGREVHNPSGFLYDNGDVYIFLEPAELTYQDTAIRIEPMTVVQAAYLGGLQIFGPNQEPTFEIINAEAVTAVFDSGKRVNLATDRYYVENGSWRLLFMPLDVLSEMEQEGAE